MKFDTNRFTYALVTSTTYGNWLLGDERGFVDGAKQNLFGTPYALDEPKLKSYAKDRLRHTSVYFNPEQAQLVLESWQKEMETTMAFVHRGNHVEPFSSCRCRTGAS